MRSKRQRVFTFIFLSIILGVMLSGVVLITASNLIHNKQQNQIQLVEQFTYSNLGDNAKLLSKQLRAAVELEFLTITDNSGNVLYRYIQAEGKLPLITPILKRFSLYTEPTSLISSNGELYIEFHSSYDEFLQPFTGLLFFMFLAPSLILGLNSIFKTNKIMNNSLSGQESGNKYKNVDDQQVRDKLTGLATGPLFIKYFEQMLSDTQVNQSGYFVLIRASQLEYLNFNLGYPAGDRYIQLIGSAISTQLIKHPTEQAFKLNAFDFGIMLPSYSKQQCDTLINHITEHFTDSFLEQDVSAKLGVAALPYDNKTSLTTLLSLADNQANN
ncbi:MAG: GGDEF domain-containing protein [Psychrosphaera sp.]|jgi:GGDEF domain-containing protein